MKLFALILSLSLCFTVFSQEKEESLVDEEDVAVPVKKLTFKKPAIPDNYFLMYFNAPSDLTELLTTSEATKEGVEEVIAKYNGIWSVEVPQSSAIEEDYSLVLKSKARHGAVSAKLNRPFDFSSDQLVVQYEVKFQNGQECGGAYIKLLSHSDDLNLKNFYDKTQYTIMFGPDRCGNDNKLHFIFQHKHPKTGKYEEKHAKKPNAEIERHFTDKKTHLYTLVLNSDNTFEIYVDQSLVNSGSLLKDFEPPVNAPKEIDDPSDVKPEEWDDVAKIVDPTATKPVDWDESAVEYIEDKNAQKPDGWLEEEPLTVADEKAERPKDWDDEMDGEWEAPRVDNPVCKSAPGCGPWTAPKIKNPEYKGKWSAPMIDNPNYKGIWKARRIPNPDHFEDDHPYRMTPIGAVGLELWSMSDEIAFDNFIIVDNKKAADDFAAETWVIKKDAERMADPNSQSVVDAIREATSERPWLWIVIILVIALPIILVIVYCCRSGSSAGNSRQDQVLKEMRKKDDDIAEENEDDEEVEGAAGDLVEDSVAENDASAESAAPQGAETTSKGDLESDSEKSSSEPDSNNQSEGKSTARKRRVRKD